MESELKYKEFGEFKAVVKEFNMIKRSELNDVFAMMKITFKDHITGTAFCKINYISSVTEGYWVEAGFPVEENLESAGEFLLKKYDKLKVIEIEADQGIKNLGEKYTEVYGYAYKKGMISDEFVIEVYPDGNTDGKVELLFVEHLWTELFLKNCGSVLNHSDNEEIENISKGMCCETEMDERFEMIKKMVDIVDRNKEYAKYKALSGCSHIFPAAQLKKLRNAYLEAEKNGNDPIDAVIEFMKNDPGWADAPVRKGNEIYAEKNPRDPKAFLEAKTDLERKRAYCFCPPIRENLDKGMSKTYCYCGAGWFRQQWEAATNKEVRVEILTSILNGDDKCSFKVILPE
jgi:hypothetical protein